MLFRSVTTYHVFRLKSSCSRCSNITLFILFLYFLSLHTHHEQLLLGEIIGRGDVSVGNADTISCWRSDPDVVSAVWTLVDLCSSSSVANEASSVLADFISRVCFLSPSFAMVYYGFNVDCSYYCLFLKKNAGWYI